MLHAFVYNDTAILVRHWFEVSLKDSHLEHGVRLELRLREPQPLRGSESAAQRIVIDRPVWRADLFDRIDGTPGAFEAAHFHPRFDGAEPCERNWADVIKSTPWDWLHDQLSDIGAVAERAGVPLADAAADVEQVRADAPEIVAVAQSRAAAHCDSARRCYAWTQDAAPLVHLMLGELRQPDLLDRERAAPWLETRPQETAAS
ncbi:hypothetical protein GCM10023191_058120 [Actinoallomurus oryzae]|uniref:Uncharacterized protein n=1 Tax=Actinoallomurus oryzae TaxID=502180 RepID=A0ABP8QKZ9_9ACTN